MGWKVGAAALGLVLVGAWGWHLKSAAMSSMAEPGAANAMPGSTKTTTFDAEAVSEEARKPLAATAQALEGSDSEVIAAASDLAPQMVQWLTPEDQIRRWVKLVDAIAAGNVPPRNRPLEYPLTSLVVEHRDKRVLLDSTDYRRADWLINVITDISPLRLAHYYRAWRPVLDRAYAELGGKDGFDQRLRMAFLQVLAVSSLPSPPELVYSGDYFRYADPALEHANAVHKLMWRLRPDNAHRLQDYLHELEQQLWSASPPQ